MDVYSAVMIAEGNQDATLPEQQKAWQMLINNGMVWTLQGWFGRRAAELIANGKCTAPKGSIPPRALALIQSLGKEAK